MEKELFRRYQRIITLTTVLVLVASAGISWYQLQQHVNYEKERLYQQSQQTIGRLQLILQACVHGVEQMRVHAQDYHFPQSFAQTHFLLQHLSYDTARNLFNLDTLANVPEYGNMTGPGDPAEFSDDVLRELSVALSLNADFKTLYQNIPNLTWVYYVSPRGINIYPWTGTEQFAFTEDLLHHEFYTDAVPERNPQQRVFWTSAYMDEAGRGLMVTCAAPVYDRDEFRGTVALDITLDSLDRILSTANYDLGSSLIYNSKHQLIAHSSNFNAVVDKAYTARAVLPLALREENIFDFPEGQVHLQEGFWVHRQSIAGTDWSLMHLVPAEAIYSKILREMAWMFFLLVVGIFIVLGVASYQTKQHYIMPAKRLVAHISDEEAARNADLKGIPKAWVGWFETVSRVFEEKRVLLNHLEETVKIRTQKLEQTTRELQTRNEELRTQEEELRQSAEEISAANDYLLKLNKRLKIQERELTEKNDHLANAYEEIRIQREKTTASITYAQRIQQAILGNIEQLTSRFADAFVCFLPRDIVSGDFYWFSEATDPETGDLLKILVAADCTGHGVPGAFMTVMGNDFLDEIVNAQQVTQPVQILERLDKKIVERLHGQQRSNVRDSMDISILVLHPSRNTVSVAGAKNPILRIRDGKATLIKGSPFSLGSLPYKGRPKTFTQQTLEVSEGDVFYLYSDGFQDQFGGEDNCKYLSKRFRDFLIQHSHLPMGLQKEALLHELHTWRKDRQQTDDILVIGIQV
ncbi:MAG: SpoIIE family protein phosphatase [Bernardetiaceae bacterium]